MASDKVSSVQYITPVERQLYYSDRSLLCKNASIIWNLVCIICYIHFARVATRLMMH